MAVSFVIPGRPIGKQSVRVTKSGHGFMPSKTRDWMSFAVGTILYLYKGPMIEGPVGLTLTAVNPRPKSLMKKRDPDERLWCPQHPDADNISKAACDALTKSGVWRDDKQVCLETIYTLYANKTEAPCLLIEIEELPSYQSMKPFLGL